MTTRGIENQYAAHEEILDELKDTVEAIEEATDEVEIVTLIAALCIVAVDAVHQIEMSEQERINLLQTTFMTAWDDYHAQPGKDELH